MIDTDSKIPVPDPITPTKSEKMEMRPMIMPPQAAATGMYLFNTVSTWLSGYPLIIIPSSFSFLAMSRGDSFVTYSQNLNFME